MQFKYITEEELTSKRIGEFVNVKIGKKTHRLFEIIFNDALYQASKGDGSAATAREEVAAELTSSNALVSNAMIASRALNLSDSDLWKVSRAR